MHIYCKGSDIQKEKKKKKSPSLTILNIHRQYNALIEQVGDEEKHNQPKGLKTSQYRVKF